MFYRHFPLALAAFLALSTAQDANDLVSHGKNGNLRSSKESAADNAMTPQAISEGDITTFDAEPAIDLSDPDPVSSETLSSTTPKAPKKIKPEALTAPEPFTPININDLGFPDTLSTEPQEEIKRVVIKCKRDMKQDECLEQLVRSVPENSFKVVHALKGGGKGVNSLAVEIKTSKMNQVTGLGFDVEEDPIREPFYIKESIEHHHRDLQGASQVVPYGIDLVKAREVWASTYNATGDGVTVCVMDTGIRAGHADFVQDNLSGYSGDDAVTPWDYDAEGHGTHVSGTIAAADNTRGVVGVAPNAKIFTVRVFGENGNGSYFGSDIIAAAEACRDAGANIISMSLGGPRYYQAENDIFEELYSQGILAVAASGNSGNTDYSYPASYNMVMSVAAVDWNSQLATFSTRNNKVDIAAPGVQVRSTWNNGGYASLSGTSMATPHVAGVAALLLSYNPGATPAELFDAITQTAVDGGTGGFDNSYGYGVIDALAAIQRLAAAGGSDNGDNDNNPSPSPPTPPNPPPGATCADFEIAFRTDGYAYEMSYDLRSMSDGLQIWNTSGSQLRNFQRYIQKSCIFPLSCYRFNINDTFGDGLSGSGIRLVLDGKVLYEGGRYNYGFSALIGDGC